MAPDPVSIEVAQADATLPYVTPRRLRRPWKRRAVLVIVVLLASATWWGRAGLTREYKERAAVWRLHAAQEALIAASAKDGDVLLRTDGSTEGVTDAYVPPGPWVDAVTPVKPVHRGAAAWKEFIAARGKASLNSQGMSGLYEFGADDVLVDASYHAAPNGTRLLSVVRVVPNYEMELFEVVTDVFEAGTRWTPLGGYVRKKPQGLRRMRVFQLPLRGTMTVRRLDATSTDDVHVVFEQASQKLTLIARWQQDHFFFAAAPEQKTAGTLVNLFTDAQGVFTKSGLSVAGGFYDLPQLTVAAAWPVRTEHDMALVVTDEAAWLVTDHDGYDDAAARPEPDVQRVDRATGAVTRVAVVPDGLGSTSIKPLKDFASSNPSPATVPTTPRLWTSAFVEAQTFSPDKKWAVANGFLSCGIFDVATATRLATLPAGKGDIVSIDPSADGRWLAVTFDEDDQARPTVCVVALPASGPPVLYAVMPFESIAPLPAVGFTPDGKAVVVAGDGKVTWYTLER